MRTTPTLMVLAIAVVVATGTSCVISTAIDGKACADDQPCVEGFDCIRGVCVPSEGEGEGDGGEGEGEGDGGEGEGEGDAGEGEGEGDAGEGEGEPDPLLRVDTISFGACAAATHLSSGNGDDRGNVQWSGDSIYYVGDSGTLRARVANPGQQNLLAVGRVDGIFTDFADGTLWALTDLDDSFFTTGDTTFEQLSQLDPVTGFPNGVRVPLSRPVFDLSGESGPVGVFSGHGKLAIVVDGLVNLIDVRTGVVSVAPRLQELTGAIPCESFAVWGVLETFGGDDHILYSTPAGIVRASLADDAPVLLEAFDLSGDLCSFSIDPIRNRWLFHVEHDSQLADGEELVGACEASICRNGVCSCAPGAELCGGVCLPTERDPENCGACGAACTGAGESCVDGVCGCGGDRPLLCGTACVDPETDEANCTGCTLGCGSGTQCLDGCTPTPSLTIASASTTGCDVVELQGVGDSSETGALAVTLDEWIYSGTSTAVRSAFTGSPDPTAAGPAHGGYFSDLDTGDVWAWMCGATECPPKIDHALTAVAPVDPATGALGTPIPLSRPIMGLYDSVAFSGAGRAALLTPGGIAFLVPSTGFVEMQPLPAFDLPAHASCSAGTPSGVLERSGGVDSLVYIDEFHEAVIRVRLSDGIVTTVLAGDLGSGCNVLVARNEGTLALAPPFGTSLVPALGERELITCPAVITCPDCT